MQSKIKNFKKNLLYYEAAMKQLKTYLDILNDEINLLDIENPINHISTRIKSTESIIEKLERKNLPITIESTNFLNDIVGARIVCDFLDSVYLVSDKLKNNKNINVIEVKDYIKNPKESGYRGIHLIIEIPISIDGTLKSIRAEIQIRTVFMDSWASNEHKLCYKKREISKEIKKELRASADQAWKVDLSMNKLYKNKIVEKESVIKTIENISKYKWRTQNEI
jgi:putative GTP pyrophosphokinase